MAQILVRDLDRGVVERLKKRADQNGRSLQAEVKMILEQVAQIDYDEAWERIERFREKMRLSGRAFSDSAELIREDRDR